LVGAGKAGLEMAAVLDELLGLRLADAAVVVKRGQAERLPGPLRHIEVLEASHPVPDETSMIGGLRLLEVARQSRMGDLVIGIVTGGSSALAVAPADGISLGDKIATNRLLLSCGADIVAINNVRKHLSAIKGGLLAAACGRTGGDRARDGGRCHGGLRTSGDRKPPAICQIVNFTVSDVVGDPLDYITDLTVPDRSTWTMAQETCDRFGLWKQLPPAVAERLQQADPAQETTRDLPGTTAGEALTWVLADAAKMLAAAAAEARRLGYDPRLLGLDWAGEARDAGISLARELLASPPRTCALAGGENTVTLPPDCRGRGGPSQEAALAAALELAAVRVPVGPATVLCIDSDGSDGPTDVAGALVDDLTAKAPAARGLRAALAGHASYDALLSAGDLVVTGPTGTNVNDLKIGLRR
jgi:hydroxypyruvate reductase/glycerate 2-kinase